MKPCQMAGRQCPNDGTVLVRIADVGDRLVCEADFEWMVGAGMAVRRLEPDAFVPAWRQRDLARDETRLRGVA